MIFSSNAVFRGACDVDMEGCAVDVECVRAARMAGLDRADARSCFLDG